jgi:hypothetical protein
MRENRLSGSSSPARSTIVGVDPVARPVHFAVTE